ncbi:MAG TPA: ABC transporter ATP-binding protein [Bacilli bacterium]|nr:ABC transporter ATP-binding protein [Bacilli bacterium]
MRAVIEIKHVSKKIGQKQIINDLSLDVYEGEVLGLLGPNGAGKTTTIRMIVGLISISQGEIVICDKNVKKQYEQAISHVGAIVENPELYKFLTGYENLRQYARMVKGVTKERIDEVIELVGLKERIHDKVKTYSLGMRQRLGLAQSLLHQPKILILDEPTNGLDPAGIREIRDYLRKLAKETGLTVIVSSHLLAEMEMMCDRIAIIQKGKLIDVQNVREFKNERGEERYVFAVDDVETTMRLMKEVHHFEPIKQGDRLVVAISRKNIPKIVQSLVEQKVAVYGIEQVTKSLEERFLEVTGSEEEQYDSASGE